MHDKYKVDVKDLKLNFDVDKLNYDKDYEALDTNDLVYGQQRGIQAFEFGLQMNGKGYNIYIEGPTGISKELYIQKYLYDYAKTLPTPNDYCYVCNFESEGEPDVLTFKAGHGSIFKEDMRIYVESLEKELKEQLSPAKLSKQLEIEEKKFGEKIQQVIDSANEQAHELGFEIVKGPKGAFMFPYKKGKTLTKEEYARLSQKEKVEYEQKAPVMQKQLLDVLTKIQVIEIEQAKFVEQYKKQLAGSVIEEMSSYMIDKYKENQDVVNYLLNLQKDLIKNITKDEKQIEKEQTQMPMPMQMQQVKTSFWTRYEVNLLVDNKKTNGAPVVMDLNYSFENIFGKVEYENLFGVLKTDYTKIRPGLIHKANGGFLVFQAYELLQSPFVYETLKKILKINQATIEPSPQKAIPALLQTLNPKPIPMDLKIIVIGSSQIYQFLIANDPYFKKLFKIKCEYEDDAPMEDENITKLVKYITTTCKKNNYLPLTKEAIGTLIEYGCKVANSHKKITTNLSEIAQVIGESNVWAKSQNKDKITKEDVLETFYQRKQRSKKWDKKLTQMILDGTILIDIEGFKEGQINGLSVSSPDSITTFGKPVKITVSTYTGKEGIVNIEREVSMSGPSHSKGVGIIKGYFGQKFAQDFPLSFTASIAFEQLYGGIDGDSASSTEIYAILSSLANVGINQSIAVTGSVNQKGFIQPIGGVNDKITGFYEICKHANIQNGGVIIPKQNVDSLFLNEEIIDACKNGKFNIYAVETVDQGIEILTNMPAGTADENGNYKEGTINYLVKEKLKKYHNNFNKEN